MSGRVSRLWVGIVVVALTVGGAGANRATAWEQLTPISRFEQDNQAASYIGRWITDSRSGYSGGSVAAAMDAGAQVSFTFLGSEVRWIGSRDPRFGIAHVFLDGVFRGTVDTSALPTQEQDQVVLFAAGGLRAMSHTLVIEVTGTHSLTSLGSWVTVDAFDVLPRFEQDNPSVSYSGGSWLVYPQGGSSQFSGGTAVAEWAPGARATFSFTGSGVRWIGYRDEWAGKALVFLDGVLQTTVDTYASPFQAQAVVFAASGLPPIPHTLVIEVEGTRNPASGGTSVWVDAFEVELGTAPPLDTTPPVVSITSPADGVTVSGSVKVSADASDNVGVEGVQFLLDGAPAGEEDTTAPYEATWDTTTASNDRHTLAATARDAAGNSTISTSVTVTVSNAAAVTRVEDTDPAVSYTANWFPQTDPRASGGTAQEAADKGERATLTFTGTGVSWISFRFSLGGIASVFLDGTLVATVDTFAPSDPTQEAVFTKTGLAPTAHTLVIEVTATKNASSGGMWIVVDAFDVTH